MGGVTDDFGVSFGGGKVSLQLFHSLWLHTIAIEPFGAIRDLALVCAHLAVHSLDRANETLSDVFFKAQFQDLPRDLQPCNRQFPLKSQEFLRLFTASAFLLVP